MGDRGMAKILNADTGELIDMAIPTKTGADAVAATLEITAMGLEDDETPYEEVFVTHEAYMRCDDELLMDADFVMSQENVATWSDWVERERRIWDAMSEQGIDSLVPEMPEGMNLTPENLQRLCCEQLGIEY
jgi:hypothetical protein